MFQMWQDIESVLHPAPGSSNHELASDRLVGLTHPTDNGGHLSNFSEYRDHHYYNSQWDKIHK